jgi:hypothetical protein
VDAGGHASPRRQRRESLPERVTVTSTSTAWAVGSFPTTSGNHSPILQWNGSAWVRVVWGLEHRGEYAGSVGQNVRREPQRELRSVVDHAQAVRTGVPRGRRGRWPAPERTLTGRNRQHEHVHVEHHRHRNGPWQVQRSRVGRRSPDSFVPLSGVRQIRWQELEALGRCRGTQGAVERRECPAASIDPAHRERTGQLDCVISPKAM